MNIRLALAACILLFGGNTAFTLPFKLSVSSLPDTLASKTNTLNPDYLIHSSTSGSLKGKFPLLIYLHGGGGKGTNIAERKREPSILPLIEAHINEPCIIISPQCLPENVWQAADLNILLEHLLHTLPVDKSRIYLTGFSMGGYGSWMWGAANPEHFAAVVPGSGGLGKGGPKDITENLDQWAANLATVPLWAFHGEQDKVVPVDRSEQMTKAIRAKGSKDCRLTVFPDLGHNSKKETYSDPGLAHWIFSKRKK